MWQRIKNVYHLIIAWFANVYFGYPSKKLIVIGVTGTDGKTTTVNFIYHILKSAGKRVSMISSINAVINDKVYDTGFHVTTPDSWEIQRFLKLAAESRDESPKASYVVLEVTSHALDQNRVFGVDFEVGVLTNVTHEHLDYHKTYENYVLTKAKLLEKARKIVINRDDRSYQIISSKLKVESEKKKMITYGLSSDLDINPQRYPFKTKLLGEFNRYNVLAAIGTSSLLGLTWKEIKEGVESFTPPKGRTDVTYQNHFSTMIDFAHTPNAIKQLLQAIRSEVKGRIIHVFGSAGKRDFSKRPMMGASSSEFSDVIILTAEDSRGESVEKIMDEIESGIMPKKGKKNPVVFKISDRFQAINKAIAMAKKGDFVVITGKGHEQSMNMGNGEIPWSDYEAVKKALG